MQSPPCESRHSEPNPLRRGRKASRQGLRYASDDESLATLSYQLDGWGRGAVAAAGTTGALASPATIRIGRPPGRPESGESGLAPAMGRRPVDRSQPQCDFPWRHPRLARARPRSLRVVPRERSASPVRDRWAGGRHGPTGTKAAAPGRLQPAPARHGFASRSRPRCPPRTEAREARDQQRAPSSNGCPVAGVTRRDVSQARSRATWSPTRPGY